MTATTGSPSRHVEDCDLMGYVDGQMDRAGHRRVEGHLAHCEACRERLRTLRRQAASAAAWLAELDAAPPADERRALAMAAVERARFRRRPVSAWSSRGTLAAAASIALLLTVAFGTPPGRAWVGSAAERLGIGGTSPRALETAAEVPPAISEALAASESAAAVGPGEVPATARGPAVGRTGTPPGMSEPVPFSPGSNYVLIRFESRQRAGSAAIWVRDGAEPTAQVVAARQGETLVPTADGLQVRNRSASRADYTIVVPTRYRFLRVQIGDEPETVITVSRSQRDWLWTVSLAE